MCFRTLIKANNIFQQILIFKFPLCAFAFSGYNGIYLDLIPNRYQFIHIKLNILHFTPTIQAKR